MDISESQKVKRVVLRFKGAASVWWDQTKMIRAKYQKPSVRTWDKLKRLMRACSVPPDNEGVFFQHYQHCFQGNRSVTEYTCDFHRLPARNNLSETEEQLIARFIKGLDAKTQEN